MLDNPSISLYKSSPSLHSSMMAPLLANKKTNYNNNDVSELYETNNNNVIMKNLETPTKHETSPISNSIGKRNQ